MLPIASCHSHRRGAGGSCTLHLDNVVRVRLGKGAGTGGGVAYYDRGPLTDSEEFLRWHRVDDGGTTVDPGDAAAAGGGGEGGGGAQHGGGSGGGGGGEDEEAADEEEADETSSAAFIAEEEAWQAEVGLMGAEADEAREEADEEAGAEGRQHDGIENPDNAVRLRLPGDARSWPDQKVGARACRRWVRERAGGGCESVRMSHSGRLDGSPRDSPPPPVQTARQSYNDA